jgi:hypothetical protein
MDLMWIPVGIGVWFLVSVAIGLCLGPVLRTCSQSRESADRQGDERHIATPGWPAPGTGSGERVLDVPHARGPVTVGQRAASVLNRSSAR